jgi:hypothetical protein
MLGGGEFDRRISLLLEKTRGRNVAGIFEFFYSWADIVFLRIVPSGHLLVKGICHNLTITIYTDNHTVDFYCPLPLHSKE